MDSVIRLFKAVEVKTKERKAQGLGFSVACELLLKATIKRGFVFSPEVVCNYHIEELNRLIGKIEKEIGLTAEKMNSSFHKSWKKVGDADIMQLVVEQLVHYFTTYGFERLGIYDEDSVYIPNEKLEIPELVEGINLVVIKGYTKEELKGKLLSLLQSGIALAEDTLKDVVDLATYLEFREEEISTVRNKEAKVMLYDYLDLVPESPVEFLRYIIYVATGKTLLIKSPGVIEEIKASKNKLRILGLFNRYRGKYGLEKLATIFYRFKSIFLAIRHM